MFSGFEGIATNLAYGGSGNWMAISEQQMALANSVTGNETPEQLLAIGLKDKDLNLKKEKAKIQEEVGYAWLEALEARKKKERDQRKRLMEMGAIFA